MSMISVDVFYPDYQLVAQSGVFEQVNAGLCEIM